MSMLIFSFHFLNCWYKANRKFFVVLITIRIVAGFTRNVPTNKNKTKCFDFEPSCGVEGAVSKIFMKFSFKSRFA